VLYLQLPSCTCGACGNALLWIILACSAAAQEGIILTKYGSIRWSKEARREQIEAFVSLDMNRKQGPTRGAKEKKKKRRKRKRGDLQPHLPAFVAKKTPRNSQFLKKKELNPMPHAEKRPKTRQKNLGLGGGGWYLIFFCQTAPPGAWTCHSQQPAQRQSP
jgi:hypothetical protein